MITKVTFRPYASSVNNRQTQPQKVNFGALRFSLWNVPRLHNWGTQGVYEKGLLETLKTKFPEGTETDMRDLFDGESTHVIINAVSQEAQSLIKRALEVAGFEKIKETPFYELNKFQQRLQAGLAVLEGK